MSCASTPNRILPANPGAGYRSLQQQIDAAVRRVLESGRYIQDHETAAFEREFAGYIGTRFSIGVGSGTDALTLALRTCGIGPGDAVVTAANTAVATVAAIDLAGATPVLVDVDPVTHTMDPHHLEAALRRPGRQRIRAVIPVHLYGHPADMPAIQELAREHELFVVEDCAQAHGAEIEGKKVGGWGDFGAFSFYPTKNLGALGDGGGLVTSDPKLADRAQLLKQYGWRERYVSQLAGMNTRLDEIQAAVLRAKLPHLDAMNHRRREIARRYLAGLAGSELQMPEERTGCHHVFHQFVVQSEHRDALRAFLDERLISTAILYPAPIHLQSGYRERVVVGPGGLEMTERLCQRILSLPLYPELPVSEQQQVLEALACRSAQPVAA